MKPRLRTIANQPSWVIASDQVELAVTRLGGHMAPVSFYRNTGTPIQPYYVNPWHAERPKIDEPVLVPLRGDFFCLPFGAGCRHKGSTYATHGEPAGGVWQLLSAERARGVTTLALTMRTARPAGTITKSLSLVEGHNVVYCRHVLEGFSGRYPLGHHATLAMPAEQLTVRLATSPIRFGLTNPVPPGDPGEGSYYCLRANSRFFDLAGVPTIWRRPAAADCTSFPARKGFCDQLAVFHKTDAFPAWTAATFQNEGFIWFAMKDPAFLPTLMMWVENHGRHSPPWNGRNCCLGLEDVCGFLAQGLAGSQQPNTLSKAGVPTCVSLRADKPTAINYIQGVVKVPMGFGKVKSASFAADKVEFVSVTGKRAAAPVRHEFLRTGSL